MQYTLKNYYTEDQKDWISIHLQSGDKKYLKQLTSKVRITQKLLKGIKMFKKEFEMFFNKVKMILLMFFIVSSLVYASDSDHIIKKQFKKWEVRHYFNEKTLEHRFSDAKTKIKMEDGREVTFQINKRSDGKIHYILNGWIDRVEIYIDEKVYTQTQDSLHTFYGDMTDELLNAIAKTNKNIKLITYIADKKFVGYISSKGSSAALRWIRAID